MNKTAKIILWIVVLLIVVWGVMSISPYGRTIMAIINPPSYEELLQQSIQRGLDQKIKETTQCSITVPSRCYKYRCDTGYVYGRPFPAPGAFNVNCTDGSIPTDLGEVPSQPTD